MNLTAFRCKDQVDLLDMIETVIIDASWVKSELDAGAVEHRQ